MGLISSDALLGLLDAEQRNHTVIANNLANVETPGYRTARVRFAEQLERLVDERGKLPPGTDIKTETFRPMFSDVSADGNDVALEREIVELNKNMLRMQVYLKVLDSRVRRLRAAIDGR